MRVVTPPTSVASHTSNSSEYQLEMVGKETVRNSDISQPCTSASEDVDWVATSISNPSGERRPVSGAGRHGSGSGGSDDSGSVYRSSSRKESRLTTSLSSGPRLLHPPSSHSPLHPYFGHAHLQRQMSSDELGIKRVSPYFMSEDGEGSLWEVWVASSNAHHSTLTVIDYAQTFFTIEVGIIPNVQACIHMYKLVEPVHPL